MATKNKARNPWGRAGKPKRSVGMIKARDKHLSSFIDSILDGKLEIIISFRVPRR